MFAKCLSIKTRLHCNLYKCRIIEFTTGLSIHKSMCLWCLDGKIPDLMLLAWTAQTTADLTVVVDTTNSKSSHSRHGMEGIHTKQHTLIILVNPENEIIPRMCIWNCTWISSLCFGGLTRRFSAAFPKLVRETKVLNYTLHQSERKEVQQQQNSVRYCRIYIL